MLEPAVDRFDGAIGCPGVEVGEDLGPSFPHRPTQLPQLLDPGGEIFPDPAHHLVHPPLPDPTIRMGPDPHLVDTLELVQTGPEKAEHYAKKHLL